MKVILTKKNDEIFVDDEDFEYLSNFKWYVSSKSNKSRGGYGYAVSTRRNNETGKQYKVSMHREIMNASKGDVIDHINGNKLDNRKENLRFATPQENSFNTIKSKNKTSNYKGVSYNADMKMWKGTIKKDGKSFHIGYFTLEEACALAYNHYAIELFGDFAKLNKIDESFCKIDWKDYKYTRQTTSNQKGVHFDKRANRWIARKVIDGKRVEIGRFFSERDAIEARLKA